MSDNLSVFAATTSAQLAGVISDETGTGALVFGTSPTFTGLSSTGGVVNLNVSSNFATNINTGTSAGAITLGNIASTGITLQAGTGNYSLDGTAGSTYTIGASTTTGTISIGGTAQTAAITLGSSSTAQTLNLGTGAGTATVNVANGLAGSVVSIANGANTSAQSINIGAGASAANNTINIGSGTNTAGVTSVTIGSGAALANTLTLEAGTGAITIGNTANARTWNVGAGNAIQTVNLFNNATAANVINVGGAASTTTIGSVKNTLGIAGTSNGNGVRVGNGRFTVNKPTAPTIGLNASTTATVAQILDAGIIGFAATGARTLTFPTAQGAAGLVQALPGTPAVGDVFTFEVFNTGVNNVTLVAGAGITIVNSTAINASTRIVQCRVTSVTAGSETISVY